MAKKKPTRSAKGPKQVPVHQDENRDLEQQPKSAMEESVEKLQIQSLKSLNGRLVKETHEKRMEFDALFQTKEALELALKKNVDEKEQVMGELSDVSDGVLGLEIERDVVCVYVKSRMEEIRGGVCELVENGRVKDVEIVKLKTEIVGLDLKVEEEREKWRRVCCERDGIKADFDGLFDEAGNLRTKVVKMVRNEGMALAEIEDLKGKCKKLSGEKMESENLNGTLLKENDMVKRLLDESGRVIEGLKREVDVKMKEKVEIEKEKSGLEVEIKKLENEVAQLKENSFGFKRENEEHEERISEHEKIIQDAVEKENGLLNEVDVLNKELLKKELDMKILTQHKDLTEANLNLVRQEVEKFQCTIETLTRDKAEMEKAKMEAENIIGDLQWELGKLKEAVISWTELGVDQKARNEVLLLDVARLQDALDKVSFERDDVRKSLGNEMKMVEKLNLLLIDKEKKNEESKNELDKVKIVQMDSFKVKKEMENRFEVLVGESDLMKKNLLEAQCKIDELKAKVKSAVADSGKALSLLNKTCLAVCDGYDKGKVEAFSEHKFIEHLEAIKASFTNKEKISEEMKLRLETERAEARKNKSFYTIVTAASTILAAAFSAVYVSKGF